MTYLMIVISRWQNSISETSHTQAAPLLPSARRRQRPELRRSSFMDNRGMTWHGQQPYQPEWTDETRLVAFSLSSPTEGGLYCAFNTSHRPATVDLPHWPGLTWRPVMDTGKVGF